MLPDSSSDRAQSSKRPASNVARVKMEHLEVKQEPGTWDGEVSNEYFFLKSIRVVLISLKIVVLIHLPTPEKVHVTQWNAHIELEL